MAPKALLGDGDVRVADAHQLALFVGHVQAVDEDLARVAADVRHSDHGNDRPVAAVEHRIGQRDDEHALDGVSDVPAGLPLGDLVLGRAELAAAAPIVRLGRIDPVEVVAVVQIRQLGVVRLAAELGKVQLLVLLAVEARAGQVGAHRGPSGPESGANRRQRLVQASEQRCHF